MSFVPSTAQIAGQARRDCARARRRAFLHAAARFLRHRPDWFISDAEVEWHLPMVGQIDRGVQTVPLAAIRNSVDRYHDFDHAFLPAPICMRARRESIAQAHLTSTGLPVIALYQVEAVYFVKDGNHRVSVARQAGQEYIDAEVIAYQTPVPPGPTDDERARPGVVDPAASASCATLIDGLMLSRLGVRAQKIGPWCKGCRGGAENDAMLATQVSALTGSAAAINTSPLPDQGECNAVLVA